MNKIGFAVLFFFLLPLFLFGQETVVKGRVTDAVTNEPIPYANVRFRGSTNGVACDFDGFFTLRSSKPYDSIRVSYLGYKTRAKKVKTFTNQTIDFQLQPDAVSLSAIVVTAGENPANILMRKVIANRERYNYASVPAYEAESYSKIILDVDHISDKFKKRKILKPLMTLFDSLERNAGEDGKAHMPVFFTENLSNVYVTKEPKRMRENIKAARVSVVGVQDGETLAQLTGATFEEYNFYNEHIFLFTKQFLSPIASNAFAFYEFYLTDTTYIDSVKCYELKLKPKNDQDLLFSGNIWVTDSTHLIRRINVSIPKTANLNYVSKMQIQQELEMVDSGRMFFPVRTRCVIDFRDISKNVLGLMGKFYFSCKNIKVKTPMPDAFYLQKVILEDKALKKDAAYWDTTRHERLTSGDIYTYNMIDTIKHMPIVRTSIDVLKTAASGYYRTPKVDIGPYYTFYRYNGIEGTKLRLGFRTRDRLSKRFIMRGYLGYGFKDQKFKYNGQVEYFLSKKYWTKVGLQRRDDIDQVGFNFGYDDSPYFVNRQSSLYTAASQISRFSLLNRKQENRIWIESDIARGTTFRVAAHHTSFQHFFNVGIEQGGQQVLQRDFKTMEIVTDLRFAFDETLVQGNNNSRVRLSKALSPVILLTYTRGLKGIWKSDYNYDKLALEIQQKFRMGLAGYSQYYFNAGKVLSSVPYTFLEIHRGNQTPFRADGTFNLMNYFEFVSDQYLSLDWQHNFGGIVFNRVPLLRRLKLREILSLNLVYGGLSKQNAAFNDTHLFNTLSQKPYVEGGVGITNLFTVVRVDFLWRLTYTNPAYRAEYRQLQLNQGTTNPYDIARFGVKFSLDFGF